MKTFIEKSSIVKKIWSTTDVTLFIFAGASAEFALNDQVDWLFYTGKLPADPVGRMFSTLQYAQQIIFSGEDKAFLAIDSINSIHQSVEFKRGNKIPEAAYKDVLYLLIYYSIASYEQLERKLTIGEKNEIVETFARIGCRMHLSGLPVTFLEWTEIYHRHLRQNLKRTTHTTELLQAYRKHLGGFRYFILIEIQRMLVSSIVNSLLGLGRPRVAGGLVFVYRITRRSGLNRLFINAMVPKKFKARIRSMDRINSRPAG